MIPAALLGLAQIIGPHVAQRLFGEKGKEVADQVVAVAERVTGKTSPEEALAAIKADGQVKAAFLAQAMDHEKFLVEDETERLRLQSHDYRRELAQDDAYVKRWRPTYGYVTATGFLMLYAAVGYAMMFNPAYFDVIAQGLASLTPLFSIALAVLGINISSRSTDKRVAAGMPGGLLIGAVADRIRGGPARPSNGGDAHG